ncbi:hypothetical protein BDW22DRAFT_1331839 [Trametopsis cervina]|nr:hypothetical protein BDW22DRAFT_1331839 [Trametopsis cervina]
MNSPPLDCCKIERHPTVYFPDGDIVLCANLKASDGLRVFRVDRVYLTRNSPVFRDMLSLSSPPAHGHHPEVYDGVSVVRLPDDADDLGNLLGLLYNTMTAALQRLDPNNALRVIGLLRLTAKYQMESIHTALLRCIQSDWPSTLHDWDRLQIEVEHARERLQHSNCMITDDDESAQTYLDDTFPEPASAILLATTFSCPSILPAAFYQLAVTEASADWDEYRSSEAEPDTEFEHQTVLSRGGRTARWTLLDQTNLLRYIRGRARLDEWLPDIEDCITSPLGAAECMIPQSCGWARTESHRDFLLEGPGRVRPFDPLGALKYLLDMLPHISFCPVCSSHIRGELLRVRQEIWDELPSIFGFQSIAIRPSRAGSVSSL